VRRFNFNLEKILQLRQFKEEECKLELGKAISLLNSIENKIKETAVKKHSAARERFNNPLEMLSWDKYIVRLEKEAEALANQAAQQEIVVEEKRTLYMEAQKNLKTLENLKEKKQKLYRREMLKNEINEVDDLTAAKRIQMSNYQ
jgi:flagellar FliJ protein